MKNKDKIQMLERELELVRERLVKIEVRSKPLDNTDWTIQKKTDVENNWVTVAYEPGISFINSWKDRPVTWILN